MVESGGARKRRDQILLSGNTDQERERWKGVNGLLLEGRTGGGVRRRGGRFVVKIIFHPERGGGGRGMLSSGGQCFFDGRFSASSPIGHVLVKVGGAGDNLGDYFGVNDANMA